MGRFNAALKSLADQGHFNSIDPAAQQTSAKSADAPAVCPLPESSEVDRGSGVINSDSDSDSDSAVADERAVYRGSSSPDTSETTSAAAQDTMPIAADSTRLALNEASGTQRHETSHTDSTAAKGRTYDREIGSDTTEMTELRSQLGILTREELESQIQGQRTEEEEEEFDFTSNRAVSESIEPLQDALAEVQGAPRDDASATESRNTNDVECEADVETRDIEVNANQVMTLVERILGIEPELEGADDLETTVHHQPADQPLQQVQADPPISVDRRGQSEIADGQNETNDGQNDAYSPVIQPWAKIQVEPDMGPSEVGAATADSPSIAPDPVEFKPIPQRQPESAAENVSGSGSERFEIKNHATDLVVEGSFDECPAEGLPSKVAPSSYETTLAKRLLDSDFGVRIQQLYAQVQSLGTAEPHVLLLLSPDADPERSAIVAGLGMFVCAHRARETLLVDANLGEQVISRGFEANSRGLCEIVAEQVGWQGCIQATSCEKLRLLPYGTNTPLREEELEATERFGQILAQWRQQYGLVLIDGGQAASPWIPQIAPWVDVTLVCLRRERHNQRDLEEVAEQVSRAGGEIAGCVAMHNTE